MELFETQGSETRLENSRVRVIHNNDKPDLPRIRFTIWVKWSNRLEIANIGAPGVYLLAQLPIAPDGDANPQEKEIIYVGETCDRSLRTRWNEFHRCAFEGKSGHSGGTTYWNIFGGQHVERLFVAALPVSTLSEPVRSSFIRFVEREVLLDYALKWGVLPKCNSK